MSLGARITAHQSTNVLTDGRHSVTYTELHREFARLDQRWDDHRELDHGGTAILVGRNDLSTAVAALHLLVTGRSCYFRRPTAAISGNVLDWSELPTFCTAAVMSREAGPDAPLDYELAFRPDRTSIDSAQRNYVYLGTSGTTSRPKLAAYTSERLLGNAENCVRRFQLTAEDRVLLPLPIAHMYGLGAAFLPAVLAGASLCLLPQTNLLTYLQAEQRFDPTVVFLTPGLAHQLVAVRKQNRTYRLSVLGADRADPETFARYEERHGCTVCVYGSTELGAVAAGSPDDSYGQRQRSSGQLMDGVRLLTTPLDPDSHHPTDAAILGFEYLFAMSGYANVDGEPELPPDIYRDGVYLTRDLGKVGEHGDLVIRGRLDDCVKRDGYLVAFDDVERSLEQMPEIDRAIVVSGESTPRGAALTAFCLRKSDTPIDELDIRRRLAAILPVYAIPDGFIILDQLPLNATGKPDRQALRSLMIEASSRDNRTA